MAKLLHKRIKVTDGVYSFDFSFHSPVTVIFGNSGIGNFSPHTRGGDPERDITEENIIDFSPHTRGYTISKKSGALKAPLFSKYTAKTYFIPFTLYPASVTALESTSSATSLSSVM